MIAPRKEVLHQGETLDVPTQQEVSQGKNKVTAVNFRGKTHTHVDVFSVNKGQHFMYLGISLFDAHHLIRATNRDGFVVSY